MYLKSLELHGFKSFPNRTVLQFERGTTVVVGPNGSGKSNISDAMRWVLGEISSRNIRGAKMEDVIFGGTDERRPMGFAEVSVTFENSDREHALNLPYDEVVVTRRYYRAGDSEYFINRKPCRLKDIYELFMNTGVGREGYSIIGQGRIAEILSRKSEDRRNFFEEAAGISKFRFKKEEAERKLADTEANMVRVRDILGELEGRVDPLRRESEKARRYLELYEQKKRADVSLWLYDTMKLRNDIALSKDACSLSENELALITESLSTLDAQRERLEKEQGEKRLLSERLRVQIQEYTKQINRLDTDYQLLENDAKHRSELMEDAHRRIHDANETILSLEEEADTAQKKLDACTENEKTLAEERLATLANQQEKSTVAQKVEEKLAKKLQESKGFETRAVDLRVRRNVLRTTRENDSGKSSGLAEEIARYESEGEKLKQEAERCEKSAKGFKERVAAYDETIQKGNAETEVVTAKKQEKLDAAAALKIQKSSLLQRAETLRRMEEHFEGYSNSVRFVMQRYQQGGIRGAGKIYGPLSQLISTDSAYITAIETALGASLQNIVVDSDATAKAAMACLKENRAGRATFYPVSAIRSSSETDEVRRASALAGYVGCGDKLVRYDPAFTEIVGWLLSRTVVFDTIDHASEAARQLRYRVKLVTLDGQVINAGGSYTGGSVKHDSGVLSRSADIEKLETEGNSLTEVIAAAEKEIAALDARLLEIHENLRDAEGQKELLLAMSRAQFSALDSANAKLSANRELLSKLRADYDSLQTSGKAYGEELSALEKELAECEEHIAAISAERQECEIEKNALLDEKEALAAQAAALQVRMAEVHGEGVALRQQMDAAALRKEELLHEKKDLQNRIEEHESFLLDHKNRLSANRREREAQADLLQNVDNDRQDVEADNDDFTKRLRELNLQIRNKHEKKELCLETDNKNKRKLERLTEEYDRLGSRLYEDYELTAESARALDYPAVTAENHAQYVETQNGCKLKIKSLGSVNIASIEEYDEVKDRYENLSAQVNDLNRSYTELTEIVSRIEGEMKTNFTAAFAEINRNFSLVFRELFGGGQAELTLTDPEDVLNCGIEIKAAPPGKIIKNLSLLSGGEQAFVACALFFAILKVNPTPFCLLDEIEAALDEVNVYRLGEYIKKFCGETQFILITHRRGTMQIADRLYGVTMPERGVSRVIALDINEMEERSKEFTDGIL